jgi:hypothetical protein
LMRQADSAIKANSSLRIQGIRPESSDATKRA